MRKITTRKVHTPGDKPVWMATREGYEPGDQIGLAHTEQDAIQDLIKHEGEDGK